MIAAFLLLAVAVSVAWISGIIFTKETNKFEKALEGICELTRENDTLKLAEETEKIAVEWQKSVPFLRAFVLHGGIDELGRYILSLSRLAETGNTQEIQLVCIEAINLIRTLRECEKISADNIL